MDFVTAGLMAMAKREAAKRRELLFHWYGGRVVTAAAVRFDTRDYVAAHGQAPRGVGSWAFCPADKYHLPSGEHIVSGGAPESYSAARRAAARYFASLGITDVVVCS